MTFIRPIRADRRQPPRHRASPRDFAVKAAIVLLPLAASLVVIAWDIQQKALELPRAGQPLNPYVTAAHLALARADAITGDGAAARAHVESLQHDVMRSARIPDTTRPIDHEFARATVRHLDGVRASVWLDRENLAVMVDGTRFRNDAMIDTVCRALDPLGDTLAVVVTLEDATAKHADDAISLSRNCQLRGDERALFQRRRPIDVVPAPLRAAFKAQQTRRSP
jgi:hypothetical protein